MALQLQWHVFRAVSQLLSLQRESTLDQPQAIRVSLPTRHVYVELFMSRNPHMTTHLWYWCTPNFFKTPWRNLFWPEIKIKHHNFIIIILFWGLYKSSLIKKEYIIAYLTLHITTSPLSFALKYYHASKYCLFFLLIYKWCHLTSADKYWRRFIVAASKNILTEYINRTMANKIMISVLSRTVVYTVRTGCYFFCFESQWKNMKF